MFWITRALSIVGRGPRARELAMTERLVPSPSAGPDGIRVNLVCPHGGSAEFTAGFRENMVRRIESGEKIRIRGIEGGILGERHAEPRDIANVVLFLASDEAAFCHGAEYMVDGGDTSGHIWFQTT